MNAQPVKAALRKFRRSQRPPTKSCHFCIEEDHIAGRNHDSHLIFDLCQFHHRLVTQKRMDAGADMQSQSNPVKRVMFALKATAVFLRELANAVERWVKLLEKSL